MSHAALDLEGLFEDCFLDRYRTRLEGGGEEPLYLPSADPSVTPHRIIYRHDYFASALHEVTHWCVAGTARRLREDYGYWYRPDGRDLTEQAAFERAEARPQAIEWILSEACGFEFHLSADNLASGSGASAAFATAVACAKAELDAEGLPPRAEVYRAALERRYSIEAGDSSSSSRRKRSLMT
jgi:elongation factor P hydroxylase